MARIVLEVEEVVEPQVFNPPRKMLVWSYREDIPCNVEEREVVAVLPKMPYHASVIYLDGSLLKWAEHCGTFKEE